MPAKKNKGVLPSLPKQQKSISRYGGALHALDDDDVVSVGAPSQASFDNDGSASIVSSLDVQSAEDSMTKFNKYGVQSALRLARLEELEKKKLRVGLEKLRQTEREFYKNSDERQRKKRRAEKRAKRRNAEAARALAAAEAEAKLASQNPYNQRKEETSFATLTKTSLMQHASTLPALTRPDSPLEAARAEDPFPLLADADADDNYSDSYSLHSLESSVPETLDAPNLHASSASIGLAPSVLSMMSGPHMSSSQIMAKALSRFHKRKEHYERHVEMEFEERRKVVEQLTARQRRIQAEKEMRIKETSQLKWLVFIKVEESGRKLRQLLKEGRKVRLKKALEAITATFLQKTLKRANARRLWMKYVDFYSKVNAGKWLFVLNTRIWRKKVSVKKIITFLRENQNRSQMGVMVRLFLSKVKRVQQFARSFLAVHEQRVNRLEEIWVEAESKYLKKLEAQIKQLRTVKPLTVSKKLDINLKDVRDFNDACSKWVALNGKMENLIQSERDKNHLPKSQNGSMNIKKIPNSRRREVLGKLLREYRKRHVKDIDALNEKLLAERKRKAKCRYAVEDAMDVLGLKDIDGPVKESEEKDTKTTSKNAPLFMFWTMFGTKEELHKTVDELYRKTYDSCFGNPVEEYKKNMTKRREQVDGPVHSHLTHQSNTKEHHRKYGLSVQSLVAQPVVEALPLKQQLPEAAGRHDHAEGARSAKHQSGHNSQKNTARSEDVEDKDVQSLVSAIKLIGRVDVSENEKVVHSVHSLREAEAKKLHDTEAKKNQEEHFKAAKEEKNDRRMRKSLEKVDLMKTVHEDREENHRPTRSSVVQKSNSVSKI